MDEYWGEEDDRGVEVEYGGHRGHETEQRQQQAARTQPCPSQLRPKRLEQSIGGGDRADQEQPGDEHERSPRLAGGG